MSKVEAGKIEIDSAGLVNRIAAAMDCHPNVLLQRPYIATIGENQWQAAASIVP